MVHRGKIIGNVSSTRVLHKRKINPRKKDKVFRFTKIGHALSANDFEIIKYIGSCTKPNKKIKIPADMCKRKTKN